MGAYVAESEWPQFYQDKDSLTFDRAGDKQFTPRGAGQISGIDKYYWFSKIAYQGAEDNAG